MGNRQGGAPSEERPSEAEQEHETKSGGMAPIFWFGGIMLLVIVLYVIGNPS